MKSQRQILGVRCQDHVTNVSIQKRKGLLHGGNLIQAIRPRCPTTFNCPMQPNAGVEQGHLHESTSTGGLAEAQGSSTHFVDEPGQEGYGGTNSYILVTCGGSSIVEIGRYGPYRLCDIKKIPLGA